jgi:hypothetical protein
VQPIEGFAQWQVGKDYIAVCYMALLRSAEIALHYDSHSILDLFAVYKLGAENCGRYFRGTKSGSGARRASSGANNLRLAFRRLDGSRTTLERDVRKAKAPSEKTRPEGPALIIMDRDAAYEP